MNLLASEIVAQRVFNPLYIYLDIVFLVALCVLLAVKKKYLTLLWGIAGGVLYMVVDYCGCILWTLYEINNKTPRFFAGSLWQV